MYVENLYLEVTRMCTLECEHCLRGDERKEYMSPNTIENIFKDVKEVGTLLLTGGEPLLAINQMKTIIRLMKEKGIKVHKVLIFTNSTVIGENVINALKEFQSLSNLEIAMSYDIFHELELERLDLLKKRRDTAQILKDMFGAHEDSSIDKPNPYVKTEDGKPMVVERLVLTGRAKRLTPERIKEINDKLKYFKYVFVDDRSFKMPIPYYDEVSNSIKGKVSVDVYGNVTGYELSYDEEDADITKYSSDINKIGLLSSVLNMSKHYTEELEKRDLASEMREIESTLQRTMIEMRS